MNVCLAFLLFMNCTNKNSKAVAEKENQTMVEIPDANFKAYLLEKFDKNKDGNISLAEAKAVKEINCSGRNIESLSGIERFSNLLVLDCSNNQLDEVILVKNKKLNQLNTKNNNQLLTIHIGMSSPLKNKAFQRPANDAPPQVNSQVTQILDPAKSKIDVAKTIVQIWFDE